MFTVVSHDEPDPAEKQRVNITLYKQIYYVCLKKNNLHFPELLQVWCFEALVTVLKIQGNKGLHMTLLNNPQI